MAKEEKEKQEKPKKEKKRKIKLDKKSRRARQIRFLQLGLFSTSVVLVITYLILKILYSPSDFTIMLGNDFSREKGIVMYESIADKNEKKILSAPKLESMDNISIQWLPANINNERDGSHNGDNYIAYTFYIEHQGIEVLNYWYSIYIDEVFKSVDEATRVMVFLNGEKTVYAKTNRNGTQDKDAKQFYSDECILLEERKHIMPGDIDKFTVVIWIEGDDPDCVNELIGGAMRMHMEITDEKDIKYNRDEVEQIV